MEVEAETSFHHPPFWLLSSLSHLLWTSVGPWEQVWITLESAGATPGTHTRQAHDRYTTCQLDQWYILAFL